MAKDTCVMCGVETPYDFETNINLRFGYIEGLGQLCQKCHDYDSTETVSIPMELIKNTPNNMELGEKVRRLSGKY
jgi:hypothetical protein